MTGSSRSICVFCSSSAKVDSAYVRLAAELGSELGRRGETLVYGGTDCGMMGELAGAARRAGARVVGVIPQLLVDHGLADRACAELVITADLRQRKTVMEQRADAFVVLPGGFGTLEELAEILALKLLQVHRKPVVLLDAAGFFSPLLGFFDQLFASGFARPGFRGAYQVAAGVAEVLALLDRHFEPA